MSHRVPDYYKGRLNRREFVAWDVLEAFELNYNKGCVLKYLLRAGKKTRDPLPDLRKALHCLEREIELREDDERRRLEAESASQARAMAEMSARPIAD